VSIISEDMSPIPDSLVPEPPTQKSVTARDPKPVTSTFTPHNLPHYLFHGFQSDSFTTGFPTKSLYELIPHFSIAHRRILNALMMEAASTSETSVNFYQSTRRNIPEDSHLSTT
jgi:hypothetical protein